MGLFIELFKAQGHRSADRVFTGRTNGLSGGAFFSTFQKFFYAFRVVNTSIFCINLELFSRGGSPRHTAFFRIPRVGAIFSLWSVGRGEGRCWRL